VIGHSRRTNGRIVAREGSSKSLGRERDRPVSRAAKCGNGEPFPGASG
jgi:hypothetical protein